MRKLLFALVAVAMGSFAFASGTPASAAVAGAVTSMSDIVKSGGSSIVDQVGYRRHYRGGRHYRHRHWRPRFFRHRHYRSHRNCWWRHGRRYCRWY